ELRRTVHLDRLEILARFARSVEEDEQRVARAGAGVESGRQVEQEPSVRLDRYPTLEGLRVLSGREHPAAPRGAACDQATGSEERHDEGAMHVRRRAASRALRRRRRSLTHSVGYG